jgi:hypothetical protein
MEMTVLEALVIYTTGWGDSQEDQYKEAYKVLYETRAEINRKREADKEPKQIDWVPQYKCEPLPVMGCGGGGGGGLRMTPEQIDAALDAAMKEQGK